MTRVGCARCWPADAEDAWAARRGLAGLADLVDESHFHVMVLGCAACDQRYLSVFTETIDWAGGEDPQYWTLLPITTGEADALAPAPPDEAKLNALGAGRRSLRRDFPSDGEPRVFWSVGLSVGPHD